MSKSKKRKQPFARVVAGTGQKHAAAAFDPSLQKTPAIAVSTSWNDEHPSWRVGQLELVDPFGWHRVSGDKLLQIRTQLANFEAMTWNEISVKSKYFHHSIPVATIVKQAQRRLHGIGLGALDELFRFRLANLERVWGFRDRAVMHVLWWDPEHLVCPSKA